ncbi:MAG TPA: hypothetical protein VD929_10695 [Caulobacteraceae bacterium]|nr:hypothetical protein [Caulobacteraceae bacterium]
MNVMKLGLAAVLAVALAGGPAVAQKASRGQTKARPSPEMTADQKAAAVQYAQKLGYGCTLVESRNIGTSAQKDASGKVHTLNVFEIACSEGPGYIVAGAPDAAAPTTALSCLSAKKHADLAKASGERFDTVCTLPRNLDLKIATQPYPGQAGVACTVVNAEWVGKTNKDNADRYEVSCAEGGGYLLDVSASTTRPTNCLAAGAGGYQCKLTTQADQVKALAAISRSAAQACDVVDVRFVAADQKGQQYYELACTAPKPGFMMETTPAGAFVRSIDCVRASGIAGGCKLTDAAVIQAAAQAPLIDALKAQGVSCTVSQARQIAEESSGRKRKIVEYVCPERPAGLVAWLPASGTADFQTESCFAAAARSVPCQMTSKETLLSHLATVIKNTRVAATCSVKDFRSIGIAPAGGPIVEVACEDGRGFISELAVDARAAQRTQHCSTSAARQGERCEIPGNGKS